MDSPALFASVGQDAVYAVAVGAVVVVLGATGVARLAAVKGHGWAALLATAVALTSVFPIGIWPATVARVIALGLLAYLLFGKGRDGRRWPPPDSRVYAWTGTALAAVALAVWTGAQLVAPVRVTGVATDPIWLTPEAPIEVVEVDVLANLPRGAVLSPLHISIRPSQPIHTTITEIEPCPDCFASYRVQHLLRAETSGPAEARYDVLANAPQATSAGFGEEDVTLVIRPVAAEAGTLTARAAVAVVLTPEQPVAMFRVTGALDPAFSARLEEVGGAARRDATTDEAAAVVLAASAPACPECAPVEYGLVSYSGPAPLQEALRVTVTFSQTVIVPGGPGAADQLTLPVIEMEPAHSVVGAQTADGDESGPAEVQVTVSAAPDAVVVGLLSHPPALDRATVISCSEGMCETGFPKVNQGWTFTAHWGFFGDALMPDGFEPEILEVVDTPLEEDLDF